MGKKIKGDRIGEEGRQERHKEDDEHKVKNEPVTKLSFKNNCVSSLTISLL